MITRSLWQYALDFSDGPVLWIHFEEIRRCLEQLRYCHYPGEWITPADENVRSVYNEWTFQTWQGITDYLDSLWDTTVPVAGGPVSPAAYTASSYRRDYLGYVFYVATRVCQLGELQVPPPSYAALPEMPHKVSVYGLAVSYQEWDSSGIDGEAVPNTWFLCGDEPSTTTEPYTIVAIGDESCETMMAWCDEPDTSDPRGGGKSRGWAIDLACGIVDWGDYTFGLQPPSQIDTASDGLTTSGCDACSQGSCLPSADIAIAEMVNSATATFPLGVSSGLTADDLRIKAYVSEYFIDSEPRQMFNLDTCVMSQTTDPGGDWEFVLVKRPSGAEVLFSMKGANAGKPVNVSGSPTYWLEKNGSVMDLHFPGPDAEIIHRFGTDNKISQVRRLKDGVETTISGDPTTWPQMTTYKSGSLITNNTSPVFISIPTYTGGLISSVAYTDKAGNPLANLSILSGGSAYVLTDANGNVISEKRLIITNDTVEVWQGVQTNSSGQVSSIGRKDIRTQTFDMTNAVFSVYQTVVSDANTAQAQSNVTLRLIKQYPWADEVISETTGYGSVAAQTTTYAYCTNSVETNNYGHLQSVEYPDGSWERYEYDLPGRQIARMSPFKNTAPAASSNQCRITRYYYAGDTSLSALNYPAGDVATTNDHRPRLVVEEEAGIEISRSYHAFFSGSSVTKRCASPGAAYDATSNLVSTTSSFTNGLFVGRPISVTSSDRTLSLYTYGYDSTNLRLATTNRTGAGSGGSVTDGVETVTVMDAGDRILSSVSRDIASGLNTSWTIYTRDALGRETCILNALNGTYITNVYGCCGPESVVDADGIQTTQDYDELQRLFASTRLGVTTYRYYDVHSGIRGTSQSVSNQTLSSRWSASDAAGRLVASTNELGDATTYAYSTNTAGGKVVTSTYPDGSTRIESHYRDNRLWSVTGTAVSPVYYDYGADAYGSFSIEYRGSSAEAVEWVKTYSDMLGNATKTVYSGGYTNLTFVDAVGRPIRNTDGQTTALREYDAKGEAWRSAVDMNGNNTIDLAGPDLVTESESCYAVFGGIACRQTITRAYPTNGSSSAITVASSLSSVQDSDSWSIAFGLTNHTTVARDRANAARTETTTRPDGTYTVSIYTNNLLISVSSYSSVASVLSVVNLSYDSLHRLASTMEPAANGETRTTFYGRNVAGAVTSVTVIAGSLSQTTAYVLDTMGRRLATILPDGGQVAYGYNTQGAVTSQSGARTYPVSYSYTEQGRLGAMGTYRNGSGGSPDVTTWNYEPTRGWLTAKIYADGSSNTYSYLPNGLLATRGWARATDNGPLTTGYRYAPDGSLTNVDYSDSTPDIFCDRDRMNRIVTVTDGIGTRTNLFAADGSLLSETSPQISGWTVERGYDSILRMTNVVISVGGTRIVASAYTFDNAGRLSAVSGGTRTATYAYGPDGATWTNLSFGAAMNTRRTFDGLNRLSEISSASSVQSVDSFSYSYNQANQRTANTLADNSQWRYQYNDRGEVISGKKCFSDGIPVGGAQFGYAFDTIGNRLTAQEGDAPNATSTYSPNNLNQYSQRTVPAVIDVTGTASNGATVVVRLDTNTASLANRHGDYFWKAVGVDNSANVFSTTNLKVTAYIAQGSNSLTRSDTKSAILPKTPEAYSYDLDGNLVCDGLWTNTWNAENRLIVSESLSAVPDSLKKRVEFKYDYMGRRTLKKVLSGYSGGTYSASNSTTYVWDGWNVIAEICNRQSGNSTNLYVWGLDLSGSLQGAGGVGGLLFATVNSTNTYFAAFDGNGNIMAWVDTSGTVAGTLEYGPFGESMKRTGVSEQIPYGFSTKPMDTELGTYHYVFRDYDVATGRWKSRDPIGERGGLGLYGFVGNEAVGRADILGLQSGMYYGYDFISGTMYRSEPEPWTPTVAAGMLVGPDEGQQAAFFGDKRAGGTAWDASQREKWFAEFKHRYKTLIDAAAEKHCVPKSLLAAVIANERIDHTGLEARGEKLLVWLGLTQRIARSVGVAQVWISTAVENESTGRNLAQYKDSALYMDNGGMAAASAREQLRYNVGRDLLDDAINIDAAAQILRTYMTDTCKAAKDGTYSKGFENEVARFGPAHAGYKELCCPASCKDVVAWKPGNARGAANSMIVIDAVWNSQPGVWLYPTEEFQKGPESPSGATAAYNAAKQSGWMSQLLPFANSW
ncbi:MAG: RHS repeat-associated core domain-containing protein [bacterium]